MQLAFIEKLFTNREIVIRMQTRYLRFKGMLYKSESYLCDIICVQLQKALVRFWCGNTQLEVVLGVCKGVPYVERFCRGCDLGKVEDEQHLLLCLSKYTESLGMLLFSPDLYPHEHSYWAHADYEHGRLGQVCSMLLIPKDKLSSMIYLSSNGLFGPRQT